jgi:hypothetical protein
MTTPPEYTITFQDTSSSSSTGSLSSVSLDQSPLIPILLPNAVLISPNEVHTAVPDLEANMRGLAQHIASTNRRTRVTTTSTRITGGGIMVASIGGLLVISILSGVAVWYIYMVKSLCDLSYHEQKALCSGSNAWLYVLFTISLFSNVYGMTNMDKSTSKKGQLMCNAFVLLVTTSWGCVEMFGVPCIDQLYNTLLYLMLAITVLINLMNTTVTLVMLMMT